MRLSWQRAAAAASHLRAHHARRPGNRRRSLPHFRSQNPRRLDGSEEEFKTFLFCLLPLETHRATLSTLTFPILPMAAAVNAPPVATTYEYGGAQQGHNPYDTYNQGGGGAYQWPHAQYPAPHQVFPQSTCRFASVRSVTGAGRLRAGGWRVWLRMS